MKLTAQEEWGLRCLVRLARAGEGASLSLPELARGEGITVPNVAKTMRTLRQAGLVRSTRGKGGGYTLARPAAEVNVADTLAALGGRFYDARFCRRHSGPEGPCANTSDCSLRLVWGLLQNAVDGVLGHLTLADVAARKPPRPPGASSQRARLPARPAGT